MSAPAVKPAAAKTPPTPAPGTNSPAQEKTAGAQLPDGNQAYDLLFQQIHAPVFFETLAARGYNVTTQKEAQDYLGMAQQLRMAEENNLVKAAEETSAVAGAAAQLDRLMGAHGLSKQAAANQVAIQGEARRLAAAPDIYNSVLALKCLEATHVAS